MDAQIGLEPDLRSYLCRLVAVFEEVRRVLRPDGTCWVNMGDSYSAGGNGVGSGKQLTNVGSHLPAKRSQEFAPKNLMMVPARLAIALQDAGWYLRQDIIWHKVNCMPESVNDRPTTAHEHVFLLAKSERYYYDGDAIAEPKLCGARGSRFDTGKTAEHQLFRTSPGECTEDRETRNARSVWTIPTQSYKGAHFATFPEELARRCIVAGCPAGGTVLDPFCGSGTTLAVALRHGRNGLGIELNPAYAQMAHTRICAETLNLFGEDANA